MYNRTSDSAPQAGPGQRGFATIATLIIGVCLVGIVLAATDVAVTQTRLSRRGNSKANALFVADTALDDAVVQLKANHSWGGDSASTSDTSLGSFTSTCTPSTDLFSATVHTVGKLSDGTVSKDVGVVSFKPIGFGDAAIRAKGDVSVSGSASISSSTTNGNDANIWSGGSISMGNSGSYVNGYLYAVGSITAPTVGTQGVQGVTPNYTQGPPLPNATVVQQQLQAQAGGSSTGITWTQAKKLYNYGSSSSLYMIIPAGVYINDSFSLNSNDFVKFTGTGTVYVSGSISMSGGTIENDLVGAVGVGGNFSMGGGAYYKATPSNQTAPDGTHTIAPTLAVFNSGGSNVSLNGTTGTDESGIIYVAQGNLKLNGGNNYTGAFVSGGTVSVNGNFTQIYPDNLRSTVYTPGDPMLTFWGEEQ